MLTSSKFALDARLALAASFVRSGGVLCDVGTDHAYLPIWLLAHGRISAAVAADVNEGPLNSARIHAAAAGCGNRITFCLSNGLRDIDLTGLGVTDIAMCGMGGELIARILTESAYTTLPHVRCVLQPMSSVEDLRDALASAGYRIEEERLAQAAGRIYTCMAVSHDGIRRTCTPAQRILGEAHIARGKNEPLFAPYLITAIQRAEKQYHGRRNGGLDAAAEEALLQELHDIAIREEISL